MTGGTNSTDFPTTPGAFDTTKGRYFGDAFVTKLNATGSVLIYSTFLGGDSGFDMGLGIAVDSADNAYVTGGTSSTDFPTTPGVFDSTVGGYEDAFVTKLNAAGSALIYSTFLGGSSSVFGGSSGTQGQGIVVDGSGNAYVTGVTDSTDFPTTPGAFDATFNGDADAFVTKLNATGSALTYSTFLGGSSSDRCQGIAVDGSGNAYVTGLTSSVDFPTTLGAFDTTYNGDVGDAFVTKLVLASPEQQNTDLGNLISGLGLPSGTANSLLSKVHAVQTSLANGDTTAACNELQALINEAQAQSGKKLTGAQAMEIISAAQAIRTALGCP